MQTCSYTPCMVKRTLIHSQEWFGFHIQMQNFKFELWGNNFTARLKMKLYWGKQIVFCLEGRWEGFLRTPYLLPHVCTNTTKNFTFDYVFCLIWHGWLDIVNSYAAAWRLLPFRKLKIRTYLTFMHCMGPSHVGLFFRFLFFAKVRFGFIRARAMQCLPSLTSSVYKLQKMNFFLKCKNGQMIR